MKAKILKNKLEIIESKKKLGEIQNPKMKNDKIEK